MKIDILKWAQIMKIFGSYIKTPQSVTSEGNDLNFQENMMASFVDSAQPLSPETQVFALQTHEQSGRGGRDEILCGIINVDNQPLDNQADLPIAVAECAMCQQQKPPIPSFQIWCHSLGSQPAA